MEKNISDHHPDVLLSKVVSGKVIYTSSNPELVGETIVFFFSQIDWPSLGGIDDCISINGLGCLAWISYSSMRLVDDSPTVRKKFLTIENYFRSERQGQSKISFALDSHTRAASSDLTKSLFSRKRG